MKKSVGIITFHASHNYGSMLQAYALQQAILNMGYLCEIINFRTRIQKELYSIGGFNRGTIQGRIKRRILLAPFYKSLVKKHILFENFLKNDMILTAKEYMSLMELEAESFQYEYIISGSDQIWNTVCSDFDWAYYLPFINKGKKIAYAPSMGPSAGFSIQPEYYNKIACLLKGYDAISVREHGESLFINTKFNLNATVTLDPTLLLSKEQWEKMIDHKPLIKGDYIFVYTPSFNKEIFVLAEKLSEIHKMKVVVSQIYNADIIEQYKLSCMKNIIVKGDVGPKEFLNLCKYAHFTFGGSFHLVVFSILLHTPFLALDGLKDNRISNLLILLELQDCSVSKISNLELMQGFLNIDFQSVDRKLAVLKDKSLLWLKNTLN